MTTPTSDNIGAVIVGARGDARIFSVPARRPELDLSAVLPLALNIGLSDFNLTLSYLPSVLYSDLTLSDDRRFAFQQFGAGRISFSTTRRRLTLSMYLTASYTAGNATVLNQFVPGVGTGTAASPTAATTTTPTAAGAGLNPAFPQATGASLVIPPDTIVKIGQGTAGIGISYLFTSRLMFSSTVFGARNQGFDYYSKILSPPTSSIGAREDLSYALSRTDSLSTRASPTYTITALPELGTTPASTTRTFIFSLLESYQHRWSPRTSGRLSAGVDVGTYTSSLTPDTTSNQTSVAADGLLDHSVPLGPRGLMTLRAAVSYGLGVNQFLGGLQNQVTALGSVGVVKDDVSVVASLTGTSSVAVTPATQTVAAALVATYRLSRYASLLGGATATKSLLPPQSVQALNANGPVIDNGAIQWIAFAGLTVVGPPLLF
ncbi:MAG TPA: hypothetical protein VHU80_10280 [Polyangiaceae bacterium]|nr:hypothetical protein [Polyangiaceae bacterium]